MASQAEVERRSAPHLLCEAGTMEPQQTQKINEKRQTRGETGQKRNAGKERLAETRLVLVSHQLERRGFGATCRRLTRVPSLTGFSSLPVRRLDVQFIH